MQQHDYAAGSISERTGISKACVEVKMKKYFRYTIQWNRQTASEVQEFDFPESITTDEMMSEVSDAMWADLIGNNVDSWSREISKEEYEAEK